MLLLYLKGLFCKQLKEQVMITKITEQQKQKQCIAMVEMKFM